MGHEYESETAADEILAHEDCSACEVLSAWRDEVGRACAIIEIEGARRRRVCIGLDDSLISERE